MRNAFPTPGAHRPVPGPGERNAALAALVIVAAYNLVQNRLLLDRSYVPANLAVGAGLVALAKAAGCDWDDLGLSGKRLPQGFRIGAVAGGLGALVAGAALAHPRTRPYLRDGRANGHDPRQVGFRAAVRFPLGTALFEEVAFRGVLAALLGKVSPRWGPAIAAAAFGVWHLLPTWDAAVGNPAGKRLGPAGRLAAAAGGMALTGVAGLGFQLLRDRTCSLAAPWLAHAGLNSCAYLAGVASWRLP